MKAGIIICTRHKSRRIPGKCLQPINGKKLIHHLVDRVKETGLPVCVAYPSSESMHFSNIKTYLPDIELYETATHQEEGDVLNRMFHAAQMLELNAVVRVSTDKIFVDPQDINFALGVFQKKGLDYLYSSSVTPGCGFEIISYSALKQAAFAFKDVEHISYAIRAVTQNCYDLDLSQKHNKYLRLLIDYPEDLLLHEVILSSLGNDCSTKDALSFCEQHPWTQTINKLPEVTVYTCAHNAEKYLFETMESVQKQKGFKEWEYIIVDDFSTDKTAFIANRFASIYRNVKYVKNTKNLGLASSSNVALSLARGKHIIRIDADDYFSSDTSVVELLEEAKSRNLDAVYPNNYYGATERVQKGNEVHHIGGTLFKTTAINLIKFTEGLRGHEGLDVFQRAKSQLKIGYLNKPLFFYRQHEESLTKNKLLERSFIEKEITVKNV